MNKEIRTEVQRLCHLDKSTCSLLLSGLERVFQEEVIHMTSIDIEGLGVFVPHKHPEYLQDDPTSGQVVLYPPRITCRFASATGGEGAAALPSVESVGGVGGSVPHIGVEQLAALVADYVKLETAQAVAFIKALVQVTVTHLQAGEEVAWTNFGTFRVVNFRDGASSRIAWVIDDKMREQINAPFSCFEPVAVGKMETPPVEKVAEAPISIDVEPDTPVLDASTSDEVMPDVALSSDEAPDPNIEAPEAPESAPVVDPEPAPVVAPEVAPAPAAEQQSIPLIFDDDSRRKPSKNVSKSNKSARKWIFGGIIFLFLIFICNICARLIWPTSSKVTPPQAIMDEADSAFRVPESDAVVPVDSLYADVEADAEAAANDMTESDADTSDIDGASDAAADAPVAAASAKDAPVSSEPAQAAAQVEKNHTPASAAMYLVDDDGHRKTARVQAGDRLTLMAHRYYGHKAFWVYIYEVNKDKLASPDNVTAGMELYLPDPVYWQIDADSETSIQTALRRASKLVK